MCLINLNVIHALIKYYVVANTTCLWLELSRANSTEKFIVGTIYRHLIHYLLKNFLDNFSDSLHKLSILKKICYIHGDFNINIQKFKRTRLAHDCINLIVGNGAIPIITKPTRVVPDSTCIINNIITKDSNHQINSFIFKVDVTDHYPILSEIYKRKSNISKNLPNGFYRDKSKFTAENFCEDLRKNLYSFFHYLPELTHDNFSESFEKFTNIVSLTTDKHAPLKKLSRRQWKLCNKPWLTKSILIFFKNKRKMFKSHYLL